MNNEQSDRNSNKMPFSVNWKDILMVGLFLLGAGGIVYSIRQNDKTADHTVSTNLIEKVEKQEVAQVENPVLNQTTTTTVSIEQSEPVATEGSQITQAEMRNVESPQTSAPTKKVESPLSSMDKKASKPVNKEPILSDEELVAKDMGITVKTPEPPKPERQLVLATDVKARKGAPVAAPAKVEPKKVTPVVSTTAGTGNYFLIASSRATMQEAAKSVEELKAKGFAKPIILEPSKEAGTTNYRIAVYRDVDRMKVDEYIMANVDKTRGYWVWQKK